MGNAKEIGKELNKIHKPKLDWKLLAISVILICFGFLVAFIKTSNTLTEDLGANYFVKYLLFVGMGVIIGAIIYFIDYKKISKYSSIIYICNNSYCLNSNKGMPNIWEKLYETRNYMHFNFNNCCTFIYNFICRIYK